MPEEQKSVTTSESTKVESAVAPKKSLHESILDFLHGKTEFTKMNDFLKTQFPTKWNVHKTGHSSIANLAMLKKTLTDLESEGKVVFGHPSFSRIGNPIVGGSSKDGLGLPTTYETLDTLPIEAKLK